MTETTNAFLVAEWEDEDNNDGGWPYPTRYQRSQVTGPLADRVRAKLKLDGLEVEILRGHPAAVFFVEGVESGGWSSWTQENYCFLTVECGGSEVEIASDYHEVAIVKLEEWLDS